MTVAVDPPRILALQGRVQHYAWGSPTALHEMLGQQPDGAPAAELWLGTHPAAPSQVDHGGAAVTLEELTGPLPFLLKVLAADKALSLQVHPTRVQADDGYEREERAGIPVDSPRRQYRDRNHKPELVVALTPFRALAGVRQPEQTLHVVAMLGVPELSAAFAPLADDPTGRGVAETLAALLRMPRAASQSLVSAVVRAVDPSPADDAYACAAAGLVAELHRAHPGDVGVIAALLLNDVTLAPGEGLFQPARMLHAYVGGVGVEVMASSDNVLRGGLTPKHVDVDELLAVVDPTPVAAPVVAALTSCSGQSRLSSWPVPVTDFALTEVLCRGAVTLPLTSPSVLLCVEGDATVTPVPSTSMSSTSATGGTVALRRGAAAVVVAPTHAVFRGDARIFVATSGADPA